MSEVGLQKAYHVSNTDIVKQTVEFHLQSCLNLQLDGNFMRINKLNADHCESNEEIK